MSDDAPDAPAASHAAANGNGRKYHVDIAKMPGAHGKPDKAHHDAEMERLKKSIDQVQAQVNEVRSSLSGGGPSANTPQGQRRAKLRAELDELRGAQAGVKGSRGKVLDELKALQESTNKKVKELQAARAKSPYKTLADIDAAINRLQSQVESGSMKIVEEKRALAEITNLRKLKRNVESFEMQQKTIDEDRAKADELRKTLDSPEGKKLSERYDVIKKELDEIQAEFDKSAGSRSQLIEKRTQLSSQLDDLYGQRRERNSAYREAHDAWYARSQAEREKRQEALRAQKKDEEDRKRKEQEAIMREEAAMPAFAQEIEDCEVLIAYFSGGSTTAAAKTSPAASKDVPGTKKLEPRKIETDASAFGQAIKKKGSDADDADSYYVGGAGKKGKGKGGNKKNKGVPLALGESPAEEASSSDAAATVASAAGRSSELRVPVGHLSALLSLSIPPPSSSADIGRVVENLKLKRRYFIENQETKTQQRVSEVEKKLARTNLGGGGGAEKADETKGGKEAEQLEAEENAATGAPASEGDKA